MPSNFVAQVDIPQHLNFVNIWGNEVIKTPKHPSAWSNNTRRAQVCKLYTLVLLKKKNQNNLEKDNFAATYKP